MGDAVNDDVIAARLRHFDAANADVFRSYTRNILVVDSINQGNKNPTLGVQDGAYAKGPARAFALCPLLLGAKLRLVTFSVWIG